MPSHALASPHRTRPPPQTNRASARAKATATATATARRDRSRSSRAVSRWSCAWFSPRGHSGTSCNCTARQRAISKSWTFGPGLLCNEKFAEPERKNCTFVQEPDPIVMISSLDTHKMSSNSEDHRRAHLSYQSPPACTSRADTERNHHTAHSSVLGHRAPPSSLHPRRIAGMRVALSIVRSLVIQ